VIFPPIADVPCCANVGVAARRIAASIQPIVNLCIYRLLSTLGDEGEQLRRTPDGNNAAI
jgi:hypothetical protein